MAQIYVPTDEKKVIKAQRIYEESVNTYLNHLDKLNSDMPEILDIMYGYSRGWTEAKYQISPQQYSAMKDMYNIWKMNLKEPDKVLENIGNELKKKYKARKDGVATSDGKGKKPEEEKKPAAVFNLRPIQ